MREYTFHMECSAVGLPLKMEMLLIVILGSWNLWVTSMSDRTGWMHKQRDCQKKNVKRCFFFWNPWDWGENDTFLAASYLGRSFSPHLAAGRCRPRPSLGVLPTVNRLWTNYQMPFITTEFQVFPFSPLSVFLKRTQ